MKAAILYFLKTFAVMALGYGGCQFLVYFFFTDNPNYLAPILSGLTFGLTLGLIFTVSQIVQVKKFYKGALTPEALSTHQVAQLQTPLTKAQITARLQQNYPFKDWKLENTPDQINLQTTFSAQSFGEKVTIRVNNLQNGLSEVLLESRPRLRFTMTDYGKNLKNVIYLKQLLAN